MASSYREVDDGWRGGEGRAAYLCQHLVLTAQGGELAGGSAGLGQCVSQGDLAVLCLTPTGQQQHMQSHSCEAITVLSDNSSRHQSHAQQQPVR
jgi:hypothetical protein